jgi:hypothetical protein
MPMESESEAKRAPGSKQTEAETPTFEDPEPRWPAALAVLAVGGIYTALPGSLSVGPRWLLFAVVSVLLAPTIMAHRYGQHRINQVLGHLVAGVMTLFLIWSLVLLVRALPAHTEAPTTLLRSAATLWVTNVLVFASWYWRLDAGGPQERDRFPGHTEGAFLFPQMTMEPARTTEADGQPWSPQFIDYLFLAFNTSTALSPTDVPVLSRWAKALCMIQSAISLVIVVILAARAVNIL